MNQRLAITPGEPAGIGPDLLVHLCQAAREDDWVVLADADVLAERAAALGLSLTLDDHVDAPSREAGCLTVEHHPVSANVKPGQLQTAAVGGVMAALDAAIGGCLDGTYDALVTGPMQKSIVNDAGIAFSGHTEYLAQKAGVDDVVMLLAAGELRVALASTHIPLAEVSAYIDTTLLKRRLLMLHEHLKSWFGIDAPRILVAGLNPHAGEGGHLGREEIDVIEPVCTHMRELGFDIVGPLPADTLFTPAHLERADGVMAMYHDQGLPVLKYVGFGSAVNVTLGLPFIRTSVDHGTALDLAGKAGVSTSSMSAALALACQLAGNRQ